MGGKLSFALAMLDNNNTGWIINAMHSREGCYTYVKEIVKGESYVELAEEEAEALDKKVKKSGLNREAYLRQLISGVVPRDAPPPDYYSMMRELHKIGNNLNQIAQKAHVLNVVDVQRYDKEVRRFNEAVRKITEAVILPEKNESWQ